MKNSSIADILKLPVQERTRLVELIWDSVAAVPDDMEISPELKAELEARLAEFEENPEAGFSWEQVKSRLRWFMAFRLRFAARCIARNW